MFNWFKQKTKNIQQQVEDNKAKHKQNKIYHSDMEVATKYITKRSEKAAFANDMGLKTKAPKRLVIPKTILVNGFNFIKYTSYESNLDLATEAAEDMKELGYKTKIITYYRGSDPVYTVYRYKQGITGTDRKIPKIKPKTTAKPKTRATAGPKKKPQTKKKPAIQPWRFC